MIGQRFGRLTVMAYADNVLSQKRWLCKCECGITKIIRQCHLRKGYSRSCGCLQKEMAKKANTTHGQYRSTEYRTWMCMIRRCYSHNAHQWKDYGGRRISVYEPWRKSYIEFFSYLLETIGRRPSPKHSLDRIDNDGNYEPGNIRWATKKEQNRNKGNTLKIDGTPLIALAEKHGLAYEALRYRYNKGYRGKTLLKPSTRSNRFVMVSKI